MSRVKRGVPSHRRHKKIIKLAKGFRGGRSKLFTQAKTALIKAGLYAYKHRKMKKRDFRSLWIVRLNAALREQGIQYSRFISMMANKNLALDRKVLSELAIREPETFRKIIDFVKA